MEDNVIMDLLEKINKMSFQSIEIKVGESYVKVNRETEDVHTEMKSKNIELCPSLQETCNNITQHKNNNYEEKNSVSIKVQEKDNIHIVKSPLVGQVFLRGPDEKKSISSVGDSIKKGDLLCIIEAMKLMNELRSEYDGEIVEIFINDNDMVEYGQPLFSIKQQ